LDHSLIIGGGVAGLVAALHLAERGLRPLLVDADPRHIGGRLRDAPAVSFEAGGRVWSFPAEHGVHGIWAHYLNLKAALARHGALPALVTSREETWLYSDGGRVRAAPIGSAIRTSPLPAPLHYLAMFARPRFLNMLTPRELLGLPRLTGDLFSALAVNPLAEQHSMGNMTLADFTRGWPPRLRALFAGLARNALAADPSEVPAAGFVTFLRFYTLLRRDAWGFAYLPGTGGACVAEPLAEAARRAGATVRQGARATLLERSEGGWRVTIEAGDRTETVDAPELILAVDAPAAARLLAAGPDTAEAAAQLRFPAGVPTAIVRLWFGGRPRRDAASGILSGDFVADNFFWLDQLQPAYSQWAAATGGSAVELHVYGPPELVAQPDAALLARVVTDAGRAFPELRGRLLNSALQRNPPTHTLFGVGPPGEHLGVETPWPSLWACGDWVADPNPSMYLERAATTGLLAANALLRSRGLAPWPVLDHPRPEPLAGAMQSGLMSLRRRLRRQS
jgi:isorenieratene synthase